jgi:hypothetical protein
MKSVGKRQISAQSLADQGRLARTAVALRGAGLVPRGVYRFRSFDEADAWMTRMLVRSRARRNRKTSRRSAAR